MADIQDMDAFLRGEGSQDVQGIAPPPTPQRERTLGEQLVTLGSSLVQGLSAPADVALEIIGLARQFSPEKYLVDLLPEDYKAPLSKMYDGDAVRALKPSTGFKAAEQLIQPEAPPMGENERALNKLTELTAAFATGGVPKETAQRIAYALSIAGPTAAQYIDDKKMRAIAEAAGATPALLVQLPGLWRTIKQSVWPGARDAYEQFTSPNVVSQVQAAKGEGITLSPGEVTEIPALWAMERNATTSQGPGATRFTEFAKNQRPAEMQGVATRAIAETGAEPATIFETGKQISQAAKTRLEGLKAARREAASALYRQAYKQDAPIDIGAMRGVLNKIDEIEQGLAANSPVRMATTQLRKALTDKEGRLSNDVKTVHQAILDARDRFTRKPGSRAEGVLTPILDEVDGILNRPGSGMAQATAKYAEMSQPINDFEKTTAGAVAAQRGRFDEASDTQIVNAAKTLLGSESPEVAKRGLAELKKVVPDIGKRAFAARIEQELGNTRDANPAGFGGMLYQSLFGTSGKRQIAREALGDTYNRTEELVRLLKKATLTSGQSATAPLQQAAASGQQVAVEAGNIAEQAALGVGTVKQTLLQGLKNRLYAKLNDKVVEAIVSGDPAKYAELRAYLKLDINDSANLRRAAKWAGITIDNAVDNLRK